MEEQKVMTHITKGLLVALVLIIIGLVGRFTGVETAGWFRWLPLMILLIAVIWACTSYASQMNNYVTFGNVFSHGFRMTAVATIILVLWGVLAITVIFPDSKERALEIARKQMEDGGKLSESQIEQALDFTRRSFFVLVVGVTLFGTLIAGLIASLIGAAVAKKKPVNPLDQMSI
ncbi:MAG TPA: DUF4199 domain-containing protein [Chitinophagaceae bacterium]